MGHRDQISAIEVHKSGLYLASFSFREKRIILWEVDYQGFWASIVSKSSKVRKDIYVGKQLRRIRGLVRGGEWKINFYELDRLTLVERGSGIKIQVKIKM